MDAFEAVRTVLAVRHYQDRPLPAEALQRILEAAHFTASSRNGQPWHFVAVQDKAMLKRLAEFLPSGSYTAEAAAAVLVAVERDSPYGLADAGRAVQSMVLTAWSDGIGSNWVGFDGTLDGVATELAVPAELKAVALVTFGYPVQKLGKGKKRRKPFDEVVHAERFGMPLT